MTILYRVLGIAPKAIREEALTLLDGLVQISRTPAFFAEGRVPDSFEGRLEVVLAHAGVLVLRLRRDTQDQLLAQVFVDSFFRYLDASLREAGVGDLTVPKRMKKLAGSFYGRLGAYDAGLASQDPVVLEEALRRNVFSHGGADYAAAFATHLRALHTVLQGLDRQALANPQVWTVPA